MPQEPKLDNGGPDIEVSDRNKALDDKLDSKMKGVEERISDKVKKDVGSDEKDHDVVLESLDKLQGSELLEKEILDISDILAYLGVPEDVPNRKKIDALYDAHEYFQDPPRGIERNPLEERMALRLERLLEEMETMTPKKRANALGKILKEEQGASEPAQEPITETPEATPDAQEPASEATTPVAEPVAKAPEVTPDAGVAPVAEPAPVAEVVPDAVEAPTVDPIDEKIQAIINEPADVTEAGIDAITPEEAAEVGPKGFPKMENLGEMLKRLEETGDGSYEKVLKKLEKSTTTHEYIYNKKTKKKDTLVYVSLDPKSIDSEGNVKFIRCTKDGEVIGEFTRNIGKVKYREWKKTTKAPEGSNFRTKNGEATKDAQFIIGKDGSYSAKYQEQNENSEVVDVVEDVKKGESRVWKDSDGNIAFTKGVEARKDFVKGGDKKTKASKPPTGPDIEVGVITVDLSDDEPVAVAQPAPEIKSPVILKRPRPMGGMPRAPIIEKAPVREHSDEALDRLGAELRSPELPVVEINADDDTKSLEQLRKALSGHFGETDAQKEKVKPRTDQAIIIDPRVEQSWRGEAQPEKSGGFWNKVKGLFGGTKGPEPEVPTPNRAKNQAEKDDWGRDNTVQESAEDMKKMTAKERMDMMRGAVENTPRMGEEKAFAGNKQPEKAKEEEPIEISFPVTEKELRKALKSWGINEALSEPDIDAALIEASDRAFFHPGTSGRSKEEEKSIHDLFWRLNRKDPTDWHSEELTVEQRRDRLKQILGR